MGYLFYFFIYNLVVYKDIKVCRIITVYIDIFVSLKIQCLFFRGKQNDNWV